MQVVILDFLDRLARRIEALAQVSANRHEGARLEAMEFPLGLLAFQFNPAEALRIVLLAKVDPLQRTAVDDRRQTLASGTQILMLVDVTQRDVIPAIISDRRGQDLDITTEHDAALAAPGCPADGQMPGEDARHIAVRVGFGSQLIEQRGQFALKQRIGFGDGHSGGFHAIEDARTQRIGRSADDDLTALGGNNARLVLIGDPDIRDRQRIVNLDARRLEHGRRQIVVADQHDQRRERQQVAHAPGKFALISRVGAARFEGIAREDRQVNVVFSGKLDHLVHAAQKIADAAAQAGFGVGFAVIFHADVDIGEMQHANRFAHD